MSIVSIQFELNQRPVGATVAPHQRLLDILRDHFGLTGTKEGCGEGECGACTVLVNGVAVNACLYLAVEVDGQRVTTIEGLGSLAQGLSPVQRAFVESGGVQCGFCSPGMIMATTAFLEMHPNPTESQIREALVGNLCRCTGYVQIVAAVKRAVSLRGEEHSS